MPPQPTISNYKAPVLDAIRLRACLFDKIIGPGIDRIFMQIVANGFLQRQDINLME